MTNPIVIFIFHANHDHNSSSFHAKHDHKSDLICFMLTMITTRQLPMPTTITTQLPMLATTTTQVFSVLTTTTTQLVSVLTTTTTLQCSFCAHHDHNTWSAERTADKVWPPPRDTGGTLFSGR